MLPKNQTITFEGTGSITEIKKDTASSNRYSFRKRKTRDMADMIELK